MTAAKTELFTDKQVELSKFARSLSHPARIAIVSLLQEFDQLTCNQIVERLPLAQATVSQHLKALREAGLVTGANCGTQVCYSLVPDQIRDFCREFRQMLGQS
ncbi:ArsR/SmtB family transcription factor [Pelagicoccus albus]|uniref:Helix-turn-helix transcriptional regulator n=1 Tax=Pelagicoccus albus TaxID=415222 RepID=A0A7X1E8Y5_9BACT|nr:metalloregulator ArsR/SmtB family transcription factor [Pelagicoccus albus]MBC2607250.1 helix-turn-helix transcriptional regulator [Pelagicoccus albus]